MSAESRPSLGVRAGAATLAGRKPRNEDAVGFRIPEDTRLYSKGILACVADGMSTSEGAGEASQACVQGLLADYYSTPESWTVSTSVSRIYAALNRWMLGQGHRRFDGDLGMVTTLTSLVLRSATAQVFHVGDSRVYRQRAGLLEPITRDHRVVGRQDKNYLARALGADPHVEIDLHSLPLEPGDRFLLCTDGIYEFLSRGQLESLLGGNEESPEKIAHRIVDAALTAGSDDNLSAVVVQVDRLPTEEESEVYQRLTELPFPPDLAPGMRMDGFEILRELHISPRSQVYLALDTHSGQKVVLKTPSQNFSDDATYLDGFLHEEWVGLRVHSPHVLKTLDLRGRRRFLYTVSEYSPGQTLRQWMLDHGPADLSQVRDFAGQLVQGLRAFQRLEMVHQDLKPENIWVDQHGTLRLFDFGSTRIAGVPKHSAIPQLPQGTLNYSAPELLQGANATHLSDLYALACLTYELLTGKLPFGERNESALRKPTRMRYQPIHHWRSDLPPWLDQGLQQALHPDPQQRTPAFSEFLQALAHAPENNRAVPSLSIPNHTARSQLWRLTAWILLLLNLLQLALLLR